jgi:hypothetical protein
MATFPGKPAYLTGTPCPACRDKDTAALICEGTDPYGRPTYVYILWCAAGHITLTQDGGPGWVPLAYELLKDLSKTQ